MVPFSDLPSGGELGNHSKTRMLWRDFSVVLWNSKVKASQKKYTPLILKSNRIKYTKWILRCANCREQDTSTHTHTLFMAYEIVPAMGV
jgi:hypothetical protein